MTKTQAFWHDWYEWNEWNEWNERYGQFDLNNKKKKANPRAF